MSYLRGLSGALRPEVEKPTGKTTVLRPLLLGFLLVVIAALAAGSVVFWLFNAGRLIPPGFVGPLVCAGVLLYGIQRVTLRWPPDIEWRPAALQHKRVMLGLLGIGSAAAALWALGQWPEAGYPGGKFLWLEWRLWPVAGMRVGELVIASAFGARDLVVAPTTFVWLRLALAAVLPVAVPVAVRLVWYRFSVEIDYPSWSDSAVTRGLRWIDPMGLLKIVPGAEPVAQVQQTAKPNPGGSL